jgi:DNA-binding CsgD family transcriptional regulator
VAPQSSPLVGRVPEREVLDQLLADARGGRSGTLVIRGEPGVGKTALLRYCAQHAVDCTVLDVGGVEDELELPFAALHQLCQPLLDRLSDLPEPQARALRVAFGLAAGATPDRLMVGLAVLTLLGEAAATRPLVCAIDDAQWVDEPSAQVLGVVARRLLAESVVLLLAMRETGSRHGFDGLPTLALAGLTTDDARTLLTAASAGEVDAQVRDRIVAETRGNPLALLELSHEMRPAELAGGFATPRSSTVSNQMEEHYTERIRALPAPAQMLMILAAADPTGDPALLWRASLALGLDSAVVDAAGSDQLLDVGSQVRFRHPLARSAAYAAGSDADRRTAHAALAAATDAHTDPDRRAWHLALAATGPDEALAVELERMAATAQARGGVAAAAAVLQRAVRLTADPARRFDRALMAASAYLHAGGFDEGRRLLAEAAGTAADDLQRARVEQLRAQIASASNPGPDAPALLLDAAARLEALDVLLARETYLHAWLSATVAGWTARPGGTLLEVSIAALGCPRPHDEPRPCDLLLDALATSTTSDRRTAAPSLKRAMHTFLDGEVSDDEALTRGMLASLTAMGLWDMESWGTLSTRQIELARASGAFSPLAITVAGHAVMLALRGDFEGVSALAGQESMLAEGTGVRLEGFAGLLVAAYRGRASEAEALFAATKADSRTSGHWVGWATAILNNALGRYPEAYEGAEIAATSRDGPFTPSWALPDLVEAAVRSGRNARAEQALEQLEAAAVDDSDWAMGVVARSQALLSSDARAESCFEEAVARLSRTLLRPDLARTHLLYGEWLRRQSRRVDARAQLRKAHSSFEAMGADAFADRARRELLATGERVRKRTAGTSNGLTPQELHIARLARAGSTNPEIAAELFLSSRTVEWHLRKVFAKLGISARGELRDLQPSSASPTTPE